MDWIEHTKRAAKKAGIAILDVYNGPFDVERKGDNSPLTLADKRAHRIILDELKKSPWPILSEEGEHPPYRKRKTWNKFWLVDPLDGTKEFVKRNGDFTVNIALIKNQEPVLGVVYVPVEKDLYWAQKGNGAWKQHGDEQPVQLQAKKAPDSPRHPERSEGSLNKKCVRVATSRSHLNDETEQFIEQFDCTEIIRRGSSLKFLLLAENRADVYPRLAPTMEWDTAAAQLVLTEAGGSVTIAGSKKPLVYNKKDLKNPFFIARI